VDTTKPLKLLNTYKDIVWISMPLLRKIALIGELAIIFQFGYGKGPKKRPWGYLSGALSKLPLNT